VRRGGITEHARPALAFKVLLADKEAMANLITQEMGKVRVESVEEADGLAKDDYLDLIAAANAPEVALAEDGNFIFAALCRTFHC
jgi:hypothetical protein